MRLVIAARRFVSVIILALLAGVVGVGGIKAEPQEKLKQCVGSAGSSFKVQVEACTFLIDAQRLVSRDARTIAYFNRGWANIFLGHHNAAIDDFSQAIRNEPMFNNAFRGRAEAHRRKGELKEAIEDLSRAIEISTDSPGALKDRGAIYMVLKNHQKALEDYDRAVALTPEAAAFHAGRAEALVELGDFQGAIASFSRAISLERGVPNHYLGRAFALIKAGSYSLAIADVNHTLELPPRNACAFGLRGRAYQGLGNTEHAIADLERAKAGKCRAPWLKISLKEVKKTKKTKGPPPIPRR